MVVVGPVNRPDHDQQHCYHHAPKVKSEAAAAVVELLMMGVRTPKTYWAVNKRQVINWRDYCIWLVDCIWIELFTICDICISIYLFIFDKSQVIL